MCWADKIGLGWMVLFFTFVYLVHDMPIGFEQYFVLEVIFALPVWVVLRFVDLLLGGPGRRRGVIIVRPR